MHLASSEEICWKSLGYSTVFMLGKEWHGEEGMYLSFEEKNRKCLESIELAVDGD